MFAKAELLKKEQADQNVKLHVKLSWSGSWKNDLNCDGVYLFAKYLAKGETGYHSAKLVNTSEGEFDYSDKTPEGVSVSGASSPVGTFGSDTKVGLFVYPTQKQEKTDMLIQDITLTVDMPFDAEDVKLFALEMVYVPEGAHYVGDPENGISKGGKLKNCLYTYPNLGAYLIDSEDENG
jgi:hypothetical protein